MNRQMPLHLVQTDTVFTTINNEPIESRTKEVRARIAKCINATVTSCGVPVTRAKRESARHMGWRLSAESRRTVSMLANSAGAVVGVIGLALWLHSTTTPAALSTGAFNWSGITYQFPNSTLVREAIYSDQILVKTNAYTFQVSGKQIYMDGVCFGTVKTGDTVCVPQAGAVAINGVTRRGN